MGDATDELAGLSSSISPDGDAAIFAVELESSRKLAVKIPFQQLGMIENEIRSASAKMQNRLRLRPYLAESKVLDLVQGAERPEAFDMFVDPVSSDLCFVYQFTHRAPFALRVDPYRCLDNMAAAMRMIRNAMN